MQHIPRIQFASRAGLRLKLTGQTNAHRTARCTLVPPSPAGDKPVTDETGVVVAIFQGLAYRKRQPVADSVKRG